MKGPELSFAADGTVLLRDMDGLGESLVSLRTFLRRSRQADGRSL